MLLPADIFKARYDGYCVEAGAGNGGPANPTYRVLTEQAWRGLLVECDPAKFPALTGRWPLANLSNVKLDPYNVVELFAAYGVPSALDWLVLDVDGYDCALACAVLDAGYRPRVLTVEVNEKIPYPVKFEVMYSASYAWGEPSHYYGASLARWEDALLTRGYVLIGAEECNLHAVPATSEHAISATSAVKLWYEHFRPWARAQEWNRDVVDWLRDDLSPVEALKTIESWYGERRIARGSYLLYL